MLMDTEEKFYRPADLQKISLTTPGFLMNSCGVTIHACQ